MKQTHENSHMTIKYFENFNIKKLLQPFSIMIFNSFSLFLQHTYLCQFQSYLFLNPKNTNFVKSNPSGVTVTCQLRNYFSQMQLCGCSRAVVQQLVGSPDDHNNNDAIDLCTIDWPSGYPNGNDTPKSHLKLNQVYLTSSSSAKFDFQPYCKTIDD